MKTEQRIDGSKRAFSRVELLAVCGAIGLLGAIALPTLAGLSGDSDRAVCANNLRLIGRAIQSWAGDHEGRVPWRTPISAGGTMSDSGSVPKNAWVEYYFLSNQLVTPKILACPSDSGVLPAPGFPQFTSLSYRQNAVSYTVCLDLVPEGGRSWVSSDRNQRSDGTFSGCSARVTGGASISINLAIGASTAAWTNGAVHGEFGHVLLNDGAVEFTSTPALQKIIASRQFDDNGVGHFLKAR